MKTWLKLWRDEPGTFGTMSLYARCLFGQLLKATDDDGRIPLGTRDPVDAIAFRFGATRRDRRRLKQDLPELLEDGCIVVDEDLRAVVFPGWERFQAEGRTTQRARSKTAARPRTDHGGTTAEPRADHSVTTAEPQRDHGDQPKPAESFNSGLGDKEGEGEEDQDEEEECERARDPGTNPSLDLNRPTALLSAFESLCHRTLDFRPELMGRKTQAAELLRKHSPERIAAELAAFERVAAKVVRRPRYAWMDFVSGFGTWGKPEREVPRETVRKSRIAAPRPHSYFATAESAEESFARAEAAHRGATDVA